MGISLLLLALAGEAEEEFNDAILQSYGKGASDVRIVEDSWLCVRAKVKMRGKVSAGEIVIAANDVSDTVYGDAWSGFAEAKKNVRQGRYTAAIKAFDSFLQKTKGRPWSLQYLLYYGGLARLQRSDREQGDFSAARGLFERLTKEVPESRFLFDAYVGIADAYFYDQKWDEAEKAYKVAAEKLSDASRKTAAKRALSNFYGKKRWLAETKVAEALEARKQWAQAKMHYMEIAGSAAKYGDVAAMAKSGQGRCLVAAGDYAAAVRFFEAMIREAEDARQFEVLGGAYCGLGDAYFGQDKYLQAMWNYKRVTVMYFTEPQYAAKAHFRAGRCYMELKGKEKNSLKFARRHYNKVLELYPDSPWRGQAEARLKAIGGAAPAN